jgi:hypothetical protein
VFARFGRLHVPDILAPGDAVRLAAALSEEGRYRRAINQGAKSWDLPLADWNALPPERRARITEAAHAAASTEFQFLFDTYRLSDEIEAAAAPAERWKTFTLF